MPVAATPSGITWLRKWMSAYGGCTLKPVTGMAIFLKIG
jgi:hypothetical protein